MVTRVTLWEDGRLVRRRVVLHEVPFRLTRRTPKALEVVCGALGGIVWVAIVALVTAEFLR